MKPKKVELKEFYEFYKEFLEASEEYKAYCKSKARSRVERKEGQILEDGIARRMSVSKGRKRLFSMERLFHVFGDIYASNYSFDRWWDERMLPLLQGRVNEPIVKVVDRNSIRQCARGIKEKLCTHHRRGGEALTSKNIEGVLHKYFGEKDGSMCLWVSTYYPSTKLNDQICGTITKHKGQFHISKRKEKKFLNLLVPRPYPKMPTREQVKACREYLEIFKEKGPDKKWEDVLVTRFPNIKEPGPDTKMDYVRTDFIKYRQWAIKLIHNAEQGLFPGCYHKDRSKKNR